MGAVIVDVGSRSDITAFTDGVYACSTDDGNVDVDVSGDITATDAGGSGDVATTLSIAGDVDTTGSEVIVTTDVAGTSGITIETAGFINRDGASDDAAVIDSNGGAATLDIYGSIIGQIGLSGVDTSVSNTVNNYSDDRWTFTGSTEFGGGAADTFNTPEPCTTPTRIAHPAMTLHRIAVWSSSTTVPAVRQERST